MRYRALKVIQLLGPLGGVPAGFEFDEAQCDQRHLKNYIANRAVEVIEDKVAPVPLNKMAAEAPVQKAPPYVDGLEDGPKVETRARGRRG